MGSQVHFVCILCPLVMWHGQDTKKAGKKQRPKIKEEMHWNWKISLAVSPIAHIKVTLEDPSRPLPQGLEQTLGQRCIQKDHPWTH
jgi:hypothetical protein